MTNWILRLLGLICSIPGCGLSAAVPGFCLRHKHLRHFKRKDRR